MENEWRESVMMWADVARRMEWSLLPDVDVYGSRDERALLLPERLGIIVELCASLWEELVLLPLSPPRRRLPWMMMSRRILLADG